MLSQPKPSNDDIEAVIQAATSASASAHAQYSAVRPPRDTRTQLFVGNLPYRVRWQDLKDLFRRAGTVLRADVSLAPDNRSRGYGTVLLATAEDAGRAIDMFNGFVWQTRTLEVRHDKMGITPLNDDYHSPSAAGTGSGAVVAQVLNGGMPAGTGLSSAGGSGTGTPFPPAQPVPLSRFPSANMSSPTLFSTASEDLPSLSTNLPNHLALAGKLTSPSAKSPLLGAPSPISAAQSPLLSQLTGGHATALLSQHSGGERSRNLFVGNVRITFLPFLNGLAY